MLFNINYYVFNCMKITYCSYKNIQHSVNVVDLMLLCTQYYFFLLYFLKIDTFKALRSIERSAIASGGVIGNAGVLDRGPWPDCRKCQHSRYVAALSPGEASERARSKNAQNGGCVCPRVGARTCACTLYAHGVGVFKVAILTSLSNAAIGLERTGTGKRHGEREERREVTSETETNCTRRGSVWQYEEADYPTIDPSKTSTDYTRLCAICRLAWCLDTVS